MPSDADSPASRPPLPAQIPSCPHDDAEPLIRARDLSVGYGENPVCAPATFELRAGGVLALVGVNGAGKSTLARTCCGLLRPLGGEIEVMGRRPDLRSAAFRAAVARDLGEESFFPTLSVAEHLHLVCYGHGVADPGAVVEALIEEFDLDAVADSLPDELSSGQRRRLALAAVLARPRSLLILDEPEQRLDHVTRLALADRLIDEREAGGSILLVSHDAELVRAAATAVLMVGRQTRLAASVEEGVEAIIEGAL